MRIGFHSAVLRGRRTGINNYAYNLLLALSELEADVKLMGASVGRVRRFAPSDFLQCATPGPGPAISAPGLASAALQIVKRSSNARTARRFLTAASISLSYRLRPIDLFHAFNYVPPASLPVPILPVIYDLSFLRHPEMHPLERVKALRTVPAVVRGAPFVHTISEFSKREIVDLLGYPADRVEVVYPAAGRSYNLRHIKEVEAPLKPYSVRPFEYFLAVGTLEPRKNLKTIVAAYAQLAATDRMRYPLLIVGGTGWGDLGFPSETDRLVQEGSVRFLGFVSEDDLSALYSATRLMLFPSTYEGFGMPVVEAMACGAPVAHSADTAMDEIASDQADRVVALDVDAWTDALMRAIGNSENFTWEKRQIRAEQSSKFDWRIGATKILRLYQQILA